MWCAGSVNKHRNTRASTNTSVTPSTDLPGMRAGSVVKALSMLGNFRDTNL